jgi:hypothetical protein
MNEYTGANLSPFRAVRQILKLCDTHTEYFSECVLDYDSYIAWANIGVPHL